MRADVNSNLLRAPALFFVYFLVWACATHGDWDQIWPLSGLSTSWTGFPARSTVLHVRQRKPAKPERHLSSCAFWSYQSLVIFCVKCTFCFSCVYLLINLLHIQVCVVVIAKQWASCCVIVFAWFLTLWLASCWLHVRHVCHCCTWERSDYN